jgi:hypothetical protein
LTYTASFTLSGNLGISVTQNAIAGAAALEPTGAARFFSYQPSLTIGYAFAPNFTLLVGDQVSAPVTKSMRCPRRLRSGSMRSAWAPRSRCKLR